MHAADRRCWPPLILWLITMMLATSCSGPYSPPPSETTHDNPILQGMAAAYFDPDSPGARWIRTHKRDTRARALAADLRSQPVGIFIDDQPHTAKAQVERVSRAANSPRRIPMFIASRQLEPRCTTDDQDTRDLNAWISAITAGIGDRRAVVVLEPYALVDWACLDQGQRITRTRQLGSSVRTLQGARNVSILLGIGSAASNSAATTAHRLLDVGLSGVDGVVANFSQYESTKQSSMFARGVRSELGSKHSGLFLLVDTARSGAPVKTTCNPIGAKAGQRSFLTGDASRVKKFWLTPPGLSDGPCGAAPRTRQREFDPDLAMQLLGLSEDNQTMNKTPNDVRTAFEQVTGRDPNVRSVAISAPDEADPSSWILLVTVERLPKTADTLEEYDGIRVHYIVGSGLRG